MGSFVGSVKECGFDSKGYGQLLGVVTGEWLSLV